MKTFLLRIVDFFIYPPYLSDPEFLRKSRFAVSTILILNVVDFLGVTSSLIIDGIKPNAIGSAIIFFLKFLVLYIFYKKGSLNLVAHSIAIINNGLLLAGAYVSGGIMDSANSWLLLTPIFVIFISSIRAGLFWMVVICIQITFIYLNNVFHFIVLPTPKIPNPEGYTFVVYLGLFLLITALVIRNERIRLFILRELKNSHSSIETKNREITESITYAKRIQTAILPSAELIENYFPKSFLVYLPKDIVSGDFYWVEKKDAKVFFAVADCTGHGVPGAMMSVICQNALNRVLNEFQIIEPAKMLDKLNLLVEDSFSRSGADIRDGMDIALCSFDHQSKIIEFAGANNGVYYSDGSLIKEIKGNKQPIGRFENKVNFTNHKIQIHPDEMVFLFTDGIADQFGGPQGKKFKYKRVREILQTITHDSTTDQKNKILASFSEWKGNLEQVDDVCLLGVKI